MKKKLLTVFILTLIGLAVLGSICSAEGATRQRLLIFTNKHDEEISEVDYYLKRGGKVLSMKPVQKNVGVVYCYIIVEYPADVPDYPKPQIKTK